MKTIIISLIIFFMIGIFCHKKEKDIRATFNMYSWLTIGYDNYIQKVDGGYVSEINKGSHSTAYASQLFIPNPSHTMDQYYLNKHNARQEQTNSCCGG